MTVVKTGIDGVISPQPVAAPLTWLAIFLVVTINPGPDHRSTVRSFFADLPALFRAVEFRNLEAGLTCVMGIGSEAWDRLFSHPRPAEGCSGKYERGLAMRYRRQAISCFIFARNTWISASNL